ncbi:tat pathway signal sequence [Bombardia bombarda]|uniref:Tat pathway signal sequence n=1 Tax=Bombardia bombarda TaxID=252184 RepID=A0AA39XJ54_9PEZI|nr:tat pathway signal sequence [Bombardia bombarda]
MLSSRDRESRRHAWGYDFDWTPDHLTPEQLRPLMYSYDVLATECLDRFDKLPLPPKPETTPENNNTDRKKTCPHPDYYHLLTHHHHQDPTLHQLWSDVTTIPPWVDWAQIARGQQVFYRYAGPSIVALTFQSLLGGMGSHRVVETLARTGGFGVKVARRRLLETFQHILDVTADLASVQPGGKGFASSLRVRFLHASVRRRILHLTTASPAYYDAAAWGVPISDLDSVATILTFSATLIWIGFPRQGIFLRPHEAADYMALWRWVAHVLGTPTHLFATPARAKAAMESLLVSEIAPTATSQTLANNIIAGLQGQAPTFASADFLRAEAYWLNGPQLSRALAIPRPPVYYTVLVAGQCLFFMTLCYVRRSVRAWDEAWIKRMRGLLLKMTLDQTDSQEATHAFQYIPSLGQLTTAEAESAGLEPILKGGSGNGNKHVRGLWSRNVSIERRNLQAVLIASAVVGWLAWLGLRSASGLLQIF